MHCTALHSQCVYCYGDVSAEYVYTYVRQTVILLEPHARLYWPMSWDLAFTLAVRCCCCCCFFFLFLSLVRWFASCTIWLGARLLYKLCTVCMHTTIIMPVNLCVYVHVRYVQCVENNDINIYSSGVCVCYFCRKKFLLQCRNVC